MLYECDQRFDVMENFENFCELNKALLFVSARAHTQKHSDICRVSSDARSFAKGRKKPSPHTLNMFAILLSFLSLRFSISSEHDLERAKYSYM